MNWRHCICQWFSCGKEIWIRNDVVQTPKSCPLSYLYIEYDYIYIYDFYRQKMNIYIYIIFNNHIS